MAAAKLSQRMSKPNRAVKASHRSLNVWIDQAVNNENDFAAADNFVGDYCYCYYYYLTPARSSQGRKIIIIYNVLIWETLS